MYSTQVSLLFDAVDLTKIKAASTGPAADQAGKYVPISQKVAAKDCQKGAGCGSYERLLAGARRRHSNVQVRAVTRRKRSSCWFCARIASRNDQPSDAPWPAAARGTDPEKAFSARILWS
jgi:hypothetical protein